MTSPLILLNEKKIRILIQNPRITLEIFDTLPSTQDYLQEKTTLDHLHFCLAEEQSQGRGRLGRTWLCPPNRNICLSFCFVFSKASHEIAGLSLVIGLIITDVLKNLFPILNPQIKWPNDIYLDSKKMGGILVEVKEETSNHCKVIIGMGININMRDVPVLDTNQSWTSLEHSLGDSIDRNLLLGHLLPALITGLEFFETQGFSPFLKTWGRYDFLKGKNISLRRGEETFTGLAAGITPEGHLLIQLPSRGLHVFSSGDTQILKK